MSGRRARTTIRCARTMTRWCPAWCTAIPTACCSWPPAPARPIAAIAPARGWWAIPAANINSPRANGNEAHRLSGSAYRSARRAAVGRRPARLCPTTSWTGCCRGCAPFRHIEFLRIGTKMPVVTPQRVTRGLVRVLKKHHPLWMSLHFTHPAELTREVAEVHRAAGRCGHSAGQPDRAAQGHQRRSRGDDDPDARPAQEPGQALLPLSVRSHPRLGAFPHRGGQGAGDHQGAARPHHRLCHALVRDRCAGRRRKDSIGARSRGGPRGR